MEHLCHINICHLKVNHKFSKCNHDVNQNTKSLTLMPIAFLKETCFLFCSMSAEWHVCRPPALECVWVCGSARLSVPVLWRPDSSHGGHSGQQYSGQHAVTARNTAALTSSGRAHAWKKQSRSVEVFLEKSQLISMISSSFLKTDQWPSIVQLLHLQSGPRHQQAQMQWCPTG